jgi:hypothetical protein
MAFRKNQKCENISKPDYFVYSPPMHASATRGQFSFDLEQLIRRIIAQKGSIRYSGSPDRERDGNRCILARQCRHTEKMLLSAVFSRAEDSAISIC